MDKKRVLFICVHNSGRSQMAEAFFNHFSGEKASASSAGTKPVSEINPTVVQVMREAGLDISHQKPKKLTLELIEKANRVITMGCGAENACPASFIPTEDWQIEDPEGKPIEKVRQIKDDIRNRVEALIKDLCCSEDSIRLKGGEK
jgi:arsenate reductase